MIGVAAFETRARTVEHLGREQIADCPTAISELWKNAFDAYARNVELNIYSGEEPVAAIIDDGHGMNREEFMRRWLVVGTESKFTVDRTPARDRNGLNVRSRQGQKGIGRLSCANLGPILLLVSKRTKFPFIAALVDWRLFENPFINLSDIFVPMTEFTTRDELFTQLPDLIDGLSENITGGSENTRKDRIRTAWKNLDEVEGNELRRLPSEEILSTISRISFEPCHLMQWPVWTGASDHGTALLVSHEPISKSFQQDADTTEMQEPKKIGGIIFPTNYQSTTPLKPSKKAFHQPPSFVATKPPAVLGLLPLSILPMRRNHLDPFLA